MTDSVGRWSALTVWAARLSWIAVAVVGGRAVGEAVAGRSDAVRVVGTVGAWCGWAAGALALAVPAVATLTVARVVVPGALAAAVTCLAFGTGAGAGLALAVPAVLATVFTAAAETGAAFVQASAYGDERRLLLRPPLGYLAASGVTWALWVVSVISAPLAWAARAWALAAAATIVAGVAFWLLPRRWHQLSRRWLVAVPAGLVVHDPVVLAETLMLRRAEIVGVGLREAGHAASDAADLTGPAPGLAVVVRVRRSTTATLARRPREARGRGLRLSAFLVSPSRPGSAINELRRRGYPEAVG